ncbi:MAG: hypothetical protein G01um101429_657 [Parcubacteria group bacterium Gr01-1014_29]|nr:MAG: hypothetical protein G01um101429_657 [Parcubacteria group bacterium Gr01-1014_29]
MNVMKKFLHFMILFFLIVGLNASGLLAINEALAYYFDDESAAGNMFTAGSLDFSLTNSTQEEWISLNEEIAWNSALTNAGTLDWNYAVSAEKIGGTDAFCDALDLEAKLNGVEKHDDSFLSFAVGTSTTLGTWNFALSLPPDATGIAHGDTCAVDIVFQGWQENMLAFGDGFYDEERVHVELTARMVVLNEFLPRPNGVAYGFDFGNDSSDMPQGEWIELYNNSTESVDMAGWYTRDATDGVGNKVVITALNTSPATTVIGGKSWLVVYMNKPILNNTGDTVRLFDTGNNLIDSHLYDDPDFCEIEPTPGDENETTAGGSCAGVPPNKSYARIPDGIGDWVDPIPTPGGVNRLELPQENSKQGGGTSNSLEPVIEPLATSTPEEIIVIEDNLATTTPDEIINLDESVGEAVAITTPEEILEQTSNEVAADASEVLVEEPAVIHEPVEEPAQSPSETDNEAGGEENAIEPEAVETPTPEPEDVAAEEQPQQAEETNI